MITVISHPQYGIQEVVSEAALDLYIAEGWIVKERKEFKKLSDWTGSVTTELIRKRGRPKKGDNNAT